MNNTLERIARILLLYGSFTKELGLSTGKMGISLFSFLYARSSGNSVYEDFAGDLIDEIYEDIHVGYSKNFNNGLAGIAWGIEFLIQNKFVDADADEVLEELDIQLAERDVRKIKDDSLDSGLKGIAHYVIARCGNRSIPNPIIGKEYIADLIEGLNLICLLEDKEAKALTKVLSDILSGNCHYKCSEGLLKQLTKTTEWDEKTLFTETKLLCIDRNGYAGIGIKLLLNQES